ncbi:hypothetical protein [Streptomyces sp. NPDC056937]|uniref:hypothetical protein n=1 Tax=Streptomyces sp. NPDC056937 TaxID=3345969 RepID=UPI003643511D
MDASELEPAGLKRISERDVRLGDMKYLAQVDVHRTALEERWGDPETVNDHAEWVCFAFSPAEGEVFFLLREVHHPPAPGAGGAPSSRAGIHPQRDQGALFREGRRPDR